MTLLYWEWHLIPRWPFRSIFARFPEQLLKDLVFWSPGECFVRPFFNIVLQHGARLPIHTSTTLLDRAVNGAGFLTGVFLSVTLLIVDPWQYCAFECCMRSGVTRCLLLMVLYLDRMCQFVLHMVLWSHSGTLMRLLAVEEQGQSFFYWPKLLHPYYSLLLFFPFSSLCLYVGIVGLGSSDW